MRRAYPDEGMKRFHLLLTGLSLTLVLLSVNRLTDLTQGQLEPHGFLRWLDLNAMLPIPLLGVVLYYLLKKDVQRAGAATPSRTATALDVTFLVGVFLLGVSSGDHETTNFLHARFCPEGQGRSELCRVVEFHDDTFSHVVYYAGVVLYTLAVVAIERLAPRRDPIARRDRWGILANAAVVALGIFANLAFEETVLDMVAFAVVAGSALGVLAWAGPDRARLPYTFYIASAFGTGLAAALGYQVLR